MTGMDRIAGKSVWSLAEQAILAQNGNPSDWRRRGSINQAGQGWADKGIPCPLSIPSARRIQEGAPMSDDSCEIPLTHGYVAIVSSKDFPEISQWSWIAIHTGTEDHLKIYAVRKVHGALIAMHRHITGASEGQRVKHLNGDPLDNRRSNLTCKTTIKRPADVLERRKEYRAQVKAGTYVNGRGPNVHTLTEISLETRTAICAKCGPVGIRSNGKGRSLACSVAKRQHRGILKGFGKNRSRVTGVEQTRYQKHKGSQCERCGFVPTHPIQLDVHHKDFNHRNNALSNLETVCANCHRLDHWIRGMPMSARIASGVAAQV